MTLDLEELERLEREAQAVSPKPWHTAGVDPNALETIVDAHGIATAWLADYADARLAIAARNALTDLIARVRELEAECDRLRLAVAAWAGDMRALAADCGQAEDEYPRGAVERELRALRAVAEAADAYRRSDDLDRVAEFDALDGALDAWRGLR